MRKMWIGLALALLATGCGGTASVAKGPSTKAPAMSLKESCPRLEQVTPTSAWPSHDRLSKYVAQLFAIQQHGDLETRQAVKILQKPANEMMTAAQGAQSGAAFDDWTRALQEIGDRCASAGSGAFQ